MGASSEKERILRLLSVYEYLVDKLDEGVHVVDRDGQTVIYNAKMAEIEAMEKKDVLHRNVLDVFQFPEDENSTLLSALRDGEASQNVRQSYFNNKGKQITTINHTFPIRQDDEIIGAVEIARDVTRLERLMQENILRKGDTKYTFASIIGESRVMQEAVEEAKRATRTNSSVLIVGETGTGKELFAQSIHHASSRAAQPFVAQNCAALPDTLIEGLLFGTTRGVFTGSTDRPGLLEAAHGGTLLLDELNSLDIALQAKLLRVLQEKTIRRIGDTRDRPVDVRIIATINEDPLDAVAEGRLRKDLYYRLSVVALFIPPLRERMDDIPLLVRRFIEKYNGLFNLRVKGVAAEVMAYLKAQSWPGNVRELEHVIESSMNMIGEGAEIDVPHLPLYTRRKIPSRGVSRDTSTVSAMKASLRVEAPDGEVNLKGTMREMERVYIEEVLAKHEGNISAAARELGMSRQSLQYRLRKFR